MLKLRTGAQLLAVLATLVLAACQAPGQAGGAPGSAAAPATEPATAEAGTADDGIGSADERSTAAAGSTCDCPACPQPPVTDGKHFEGKLVVGESEFVYIEPGPLKLRARVDSGATTSSLHAGDVVRFERDGEAWVRFTTWANSREKPVTLELPVSRKVRIKTKTDAVDRRVVVEVNLRVGDITQLVEVSLADRGDFEYPVLIGRNFLRDVAVIDVSRAYIHGS